MYKVTSFRESRHKITNFFYIYKKKMKKRQKKAKKANRLFKMYETSGFM